MKVKAIILAAGPTTSVEKYKSKHYFPPDSKPKCLFHFGGGGGTLYPENETLLERQVRVLNECGVTDIRVVVGWKKEMIQQYIEEKKWDVETVYNPDYPRERKGRKTGRGWLKGLQSVRVGLQGVDDDVLIMPSDVALHKIGVTRILQEKYKQAVICYHIVKISREKLPLLRKYRKPGFMLSLYEFVMEHDGVIIGKTHYRNDAEKAAMILRTDDPEFKPLISDVDYYSQTREGLALFKKLGMTGKEFLALPVDEIIRLLREET